MLPINIITILCCIVFLCEADVNQFARRSLHVLFQKSDQNNDYYLDKLELKTFIRKIVKRVPEIYKGTKYSVDALEGSSVLAEDLFKKHDKNRDGKLSFRGSLVKKSEATVFGDLIEKVVVNLMHEISNITPPYKGLNPFD